MNKIFGVWAFAATVGWIARPADGSPPPRAAPGTAVIDRRYENPHETIYRAHAANLDGIADLLEELGRAPRTQEPLLREVEESERGYEALILVPKPAPEEPAVPAPPYPFFASRSVLDLLVQLLLPTLDYEEAPLPNRSDTSPAEPPQSNLADEHPPGGTSIDEIAVESVYSTSIGNIARGRARGREIPARSPGTSDLEEPFRHDPRLRRDPFVDLSARPDPEPFRARPGLSGLWIAPRPRTAAAISWEESSGIPAFDAIFSRENQMFSELRSGPDPPSARRDPFRPLPPAQALVSRDPSLYSRSTCAVLAGTNGLRIRSLAEAERWLARYRRDRDLIAESPARNGLWARRFLADLDRATFGSTIGSAEAFALLGDLFVLAERLPRAAEMYALAERTAPGQPTRCGRLFEGKLYAAERLGFSVPLDTSYLPSYPTLTGYLLAWDLAAGRVVERHLLPAVPRAFTIERGALRITLEGGGAVVLAGGHAMPPTYASSGLDLRYAAIRKGRWLAGNFIGPPSGGRRPRFRLNRYLHYRLPLDLPELEQALSAAAERDPTQPWHPFFLGQIRFAEGRRRQAEAIWSKLWSEATANTPYYELFQMALLHERFGQPGWAGLAYGQALQARRRLDRPIVSCREAERDLNADGDALAHLARDPARHHLWWRRLREISGVAPGDAFRAVLWAAELERRGDRDAAREERAYAQRARSLPLDPASRSAWFDYCLYGVAACASMFFAQLAVGAGRWVLALKGRRFRTPLRESPWRKLLRRSPLLWVPISLGFALGLWVQSASYLRVFADRAPADLGDVGYIARGPRLPEARVPLAFVEVLADSLEAGQVQTITGRQIPSPVARLAQRVRSLGAFRQALLVSAVVGGLFLLAFPWGFLLTRAAVRSWAARWIPGAAQVRAGLPLRGYVVFGLFVFAAAPLVWIATARICDAVAAPGIVSANFLLHSNLAETLMPLDESENAGAWDRRENFERLRERSFVPLLFVYPGAEAFGSLVAAALALSVGVLLWSRRRAASGDAA